MPDMIHISGGVVILTAVAADHAVVALQLKPVLTARFTWICTTTAVLVWEKFTLLPTLVLGGLRIKQSLT
jgi:hypothetical protein